MTNKEQYLSFCIEEQLPLLMQSWWLDAVCGPDNWDLALSFDKEGKVNGVLPFYIRRKYGLSRITMPPLTDYLGPWLKFPEEDKLKKVSRYNIETNILSGLIEQLPDVDFFYQTFFPEVESALPFLWQGFKTGIYYTYRLNAPLDTKNVFENFKYTVRTEIRKAEKKVNVENSGDLASFYKIHSKSFERKGTRPPLEYADLENIDEGIKQKAGREILLARDIADESIHAGLYTVKDDSTVYILLTGIDPVLKSSGAMYLLYWEVIQSAAERGLSVDFCGSILPGVEPSIRSLGGDRMPYLCMTKTRNRFLGMISILLGKQY